MLWRCYSGLSSDMFWVSLLYFHICWVRLLFSFLLPPLFSSPPFPPPPSPIKVTFQNITLSLPKCSTEVHGFQIIKN